MLTTKLCGLLIASTMLLMAQLNRGTLAGTVTDSTEAVIPGAKVLIQDTGTGARFEALVNEAGQYSVPGLPPGSYTLRFSSPAFKTLDRQGIVLGATQVVRVDAMLEVGQITETVSVTAEASRLQSETREVSTSISNKQLVDLPLSFSGVRSPETFAYKITPGVNGNAWTSHINGSTQYSKDVLVDGASATTQLGGDFTTGPVSVEALGEFKILTSGMAAEFGRSQGGLFNFVMKSGTNDPHGSAFGILRNEALNANSFSNKFNGVRRPLDRKQDFGFSFGSPIYLPKIYNGRNKTFYYTSYERYRERNFGFKSPDRTLPIPDFYDGNFSRLLGPATGQKDVLGNDVLRGAIYDPNSFAQVAGGRYTGEMFPGNVIPVSRFSQVSRRVADLAKKYYLPTVRDSSGAIALQNNSTFPVANAPVYDNHQFSLKLDEMLTGSQRLSGSFSYAIKNRSTLADAGGPWAAGSDDGGPFSASRNQRLVTQYWRLAHDWTLTPGLLNNINLSFNWLNAPTLSKHVDVDGAKDLGIKNLSTLGYPTINWGGGPIIGLTNLGDPVKTVNHYMQWGLADSLSFQRGRHFMKAGIDLRTNHMNATATQGGGVNFAARATSIPNEAFSGNLTGYAMASFLLGIVDSAGLNDPVVLGGRRHYYGLFFQDDFKATKRLTLQLGMRWEYQPPVFEAADRLSSWSPTAKDPISGLPGAYTFAGGCSACTGQRYFGSASRRDWGPRMGFAYRASERITMRGGYGIFFAGDVFNNFNSTPLGKPTNVQWGGTYNLAADPVNPWKGIFNWDSGFPTNAYRPPALDASWGNSNRPGMIDKSYGRTPYVQEFNLNIQGEVWRKIVVDVGYIGNKSTGLYNGNLEQLNQLPASVLTQYGRNLNNAVRTAADAAANGIPYPYAGFSGTVGSALRQFPQVQGNSTINDFGATRGFAAYHSFQITANRQFSRGLSVYANYVWSKNMTNTQSSMIGDNGGPLDYYNLKLEKSLASYDQPHMFKAYVDYELPFGKGKPVWGSAGRIANAFVGGWSVNAILNYFSGTPLGFGGSFPLSGGWNGATNRANIAPGDLKNGSFDKANFQLGAVNSVSNTYLNKGIYSDPAPLTLGTSAPRYGQARGFATRNEDFGLQKNFRFHEKYRFQLRAEFLNATNRHTLGGLNTTVTNPLFGQVTSVGGNREVQLGTRLDF